ncbi:hypothetical protein GCM10007103_08800 [Salinimicrobium marinum]|uniref:Lumazine-binding n=1 Tax=Salinimicrobium marinum TaxID=680283 RepID=A0A918VWG7_9FLAO|nr:nuclear transport factor 2 family protein [Salinimicrobium marinum]GHA29777.1 hypothetical protein GCM10007103_08800 [Salinimicrobium marinum]
MKKLISALFIIVFSITSYSQKTSEEENVKQTIETFFDGFHSRDSLIMKSVVNEEIVMQSIGRNPEGELKLHHEDFGKFLKSIISIPATTLFREELHSYEIKIDGDMANVWTPYTLYVNEVFQHCGVNNFQLFRKNEEWQIIYLVDTRRKEGCDQRKLE